MTPHQILIVALRILAIIWFLHTVGLLVTNLVYLDPLGVDSSGRIAAWLVAVTQLMACALLWLFPAAAASKLLRNKVNPENAATTPLHEWQTMIVIGIGLWALVRVFPDVIYWTSFVTMGGNEGYLQSELTNEHRANILSTIAEVALGFWLLLGGPGFAAFLLRVRTAGLKK